MAPKRTQFCRQCGAAVSAADRFCPSCGAPVAAGAAGSRQAAPAPAGDPYEYHTVNVEVLSGAGAKKTNNVIKKMQDAGWEFVSQSAGSGALSGSAQTLMFRRLRGSSTKKPPVGHTQRTCCSSVFVLALAPWLIGALAWRRRNGRRPL